MNFMESDATICNYLNFMGATICNYLTEISGTF